MTRRTDAGVSLLNVLVVVAAGAGLVQVMLTGQDRAIGRLAGANDAAQASALAEGGVASLATALRRDLLEAPDSDHAGEAWAEAAQEIITLDFGSFAVDVEDLRGRFDLNALGPGKLGELRVFGALLAQLDLPEVLAAQIAEIVANDGPLSAPGDLLRYGLSNADLARLADHVVTLGTRHPMNLNAVGEPLLAALLSNTAAARSLIARRTAKGFLDRSDLAALGLVQPPFSGFTSDAFMVRAMAEVGEARTILTRRILRDPEAGTIRIIAE